MKTFKQFKEDNQHLPEGVGAIVGGALKLGGKALSAYSAYKAGESLVKGKPKQAAFNALGAVPGGKVFKGVRALGGAKNLAKAGSTAQSITRYNVTGKTPKLLGASSPVAMAKTPGSFSAFEVSMLTTLA